MMSISLYQRLPRSLTRRTVLIVPPANLTRRLLSTSMTRMARMEYSVEEVQIPVPVPNSVQQGHIAGRLFQGKTASSMSELSPRYPPVICIHGWGDSATSFDPILPQVVSGRNITALSFDLTGHGKSSHPPGPFTDLHYETNLAILRLIRYYKWEKVIILGHSFGGGVSLSFAASFPELVHSIIVLDILPSIVYGMLATKPYLAVMKRNLEILSDIEVQAAKETPAAPAEYTREEMIEKMMKGRMISLSREGCDKLIDRGSIVQPNGKLSFSHDPRGKVFLFNGIISWSANFRLYAQHTKCPTLLINMHPRQPKDQFDELLKILTTNIAKCKVAEVEGSAMHHAHMLSPELVSPLVNDFMKSNL